jgi:hypothetical protein
MLPIIRRIRHPLLPPEPAGAQIVANQEKESSRVGTAGNETSASAASQIHDLLPELTDHPHHKSEKRSDSGQFRSDLVTSGTEIGASEVRGPNGANIHETIAGSDQHSKINSQPSSARDQLDDCWLRLKSEAAADYQLFAAWLQLPAPRSYRGAAVALGWSVHRLRRIAAGNHWKSRTAAFDNHRANAASQALDQMVGKEISDCEARARQFRIQEWLLHEQMREAALAITAELKRRPGRVRLRDITKLFELASVLGRRACGLPLDSDSPEPAPLPPRPDVEAALNKIYGDDSDSPSI